MLRSMTGFASQTITLATNTNKTQVVINLKSLNSRFFESTCKLHYQINNLEIDLIKLLKSNLYRGHLYITIYITNPDFFKGSVEPSLPLLAGYMRAIEKIKEHYTIHDTLSINTILQLPNIFTIEEKNIDEHAKSLIFEATKAAIDILIQTQNKEGGVLKKDLEDRIAIMQSNISTIEQDSVALMTRQKEKIGKLLQEMNPDHPASADTHKNAYLLLDKMDINEEIVRFKSHLKNLHSIITDADVEKGKRIDFTLQEMAREINTIAAKCSDATISTLAITIKVELEKAREQAQNIV